MRKRVLFVIFLLFYVFSLYSQAIEQNIPWYIGKKIAGFEFIGLKNVLLTQLHPFESEFSGREFSDDLYMEIFTTLSSLDYFDSFEVKASDPTNPENIKDAGRKEEVVLEFLVIENPIIDNIFISGNTNIRKTDVLSELISVTGEQFKRTNLRVDRKAIKLLYVDKGYPETKVKSKYDLDEENGRVVVYFEISEGVKRVVSSINFIGNTVFRDFKLKTSIELKNQTLIRDGLFDEILLENDIEAIETLYKEKGYIKAKVTEVKKQIKKNIELNQEELSLLFVIEEGEQYFFGGVSFYGNDIFSTKVLKTIIPLKPGDVLNKVRFQGAMDFIKSLYMGDGYMFNEYDIYEMVSEDERVISYRMTIIERPRAHIENIVIKGLEKTEEHVVTRELPFKEGDVFSYSRVQRGIQNLMMLNIFEQDGVDVKPSVGSAPGLMNLVIILTEGRTTDIQFGVNFAQTLHDEFPMQFFLKWEERNLRGKGQYLSVGTELNTNTQRISLSFREKWLGGERVSIGTSFGFEHNKRSQVYQDQLAPVGAGLPDPYEGNYYFKDDTVVDGKQYDAGDIVDWDRISLDEVEKYNLITDYDYFSVLMGEPVSSDFLMNYTRYSVFAGVNSGYSWITEAGRLSLSTGISFSLEYNTFDSSIYRPLEGWLFENNDKWVMGNKWTTSLILDNRNHPTNPTDGFLFKEVFTYSGGALFGKTHYNKSRTTLEYFKTLFDIPVHEKWHYKTVLALHTSLHLCFDQFHLSKNGSTDEFSLQTGIVARPEDMLYTDRMNILRGWDNKTNLEAIWENWIELRMPIYEKYVWADLFFEMTGIWNDLDSMIPSHQTGYYHEAIADDFYFTIGGGFRLTLPQFPIAVYLTKGFQVQYDSAHNPIIDWQKGQFANKNDTDNGGINLVFRLIYSY